MKGQKTVLRYLSIWGFLLLLAIQLFIPTIPAQSPKTTKQETLISPSSDSSSTQNEHDNSKLVIKLSTNIVSFNVTVTDPYGRYVTGLSKEHFEVYDNKVPQKIDYFTNKDVPLSVGIIFDISSSMKGKLKGSFNALHKFCENSHLLDEYFLVTFENTAKLSQDFTSDPSNIINSLALVETKGQTALYDATYIGVEKIRTSKHSRKALLLISDGQDNSSYYSLKELREMLKETDVQIYAIGISNVFSGSDLDVQGQVILEELTRLTGGRAFFPNKETELNEVVNRIGLELRHQYSIAYEPTSTDKHWHKIQVKVKSPKGMPSLSVRAREGYFAKNSNTKR